VKLIAREKNVEEKAAKEKKPKRETEKKAA
jgi:hypothetical protein